MSGELRLLAVALLAVLVAGCTSGAAPGDNNYISPRVQYVHDATHGVSCWLAATGISCLPDAQVRLP